MSRERPTHVGYVLKKFPRLSETFVLSEILAAEAAGVDVTVASLRVPDEARFHPDLGRLQAEILHAPALSKLTLGDALGALALQPPSPTDDGLARVLAFTDRLPVERRAEVFLHGVWLARLVGERHLDHLHAHFATVASHVAHVASLLTGVPFSVTAHAKDIYRTAVDWDVTGAVLEAASTVVTVCEANAAHLDARLPAGARIRRIYNGLSPQPAPVHAFDAREPVILGVGRLVEKKGFGDLLGAVAALPALDGRSAPRVVLIGDGDDRSHLEQLARTLGIADRVDFLGARPQPVVAEWLRRARVLAAPCVVGSDGNQDALPTVLLEALAAGTPVVTTDVGGITEIVDHGRHGLVVPQRDPASLAAALCQVLDDPAGWVAMSQAGPERIAERFDRAATVGELVEVFEGRNRVLVP